MTVRRGRVVNKGVPGIVWLLLVLGGLMLIGLVTGPKTEQQPTSATQQTNGY